MQRKLKTYKIESIYFLKALHSSLLLLVFWGRCNLHSIYFQLPPQNFPHHQEQNKALHGLPFWQVQDLRGLA